MRMLAEYITATIKKGVVPFSYRAAFALIVSRTENLAVTEDIMKKNNYCEILEKNTLPYGLRLIGNNFELMHDNDIKHTASVCGNYIPY